MNETAQHAREVLTGPNATIRIPFTKNGDINYAGLTHYVDRCIEGRSKSIVLTHGDSLLSLLTHAEIAEVTRTVHAHVGNRAFFCAATGIWSTREAVEYTEFCRDLGVEMVMALPPDWGRSCDTDDFVQYYATISEILPVMMVTNVFMRRGNEFGLETIQAVRDRVPGVVAVKDDVCGEFGQELSKLVYGKWAVFVGGQKRNHMNVLDYGADGFLSTYMSFKPDVAWEYWGAATSGDIEKAQTVIDRYEVPLFDFVMSLSGGFDSGLHGVYELTGTYERWRRNPYRDATDEEMEKLAGLCRQLEII